MESISRGNWSLLALTLDLLVPPLALLTLILGAAFSLSWFMFVFFGALALPDIYWLLSGWH